MQFVIDLLGISVIPIAMYFRKLPLFQFAAAATPVNPWNVGHILTYMPRYNTVNYNRISSTAMQWQG